MYEVSVAKIIFVTFDVLKSIPFFSFSRQILNLHMAVVATYTGGAYPSGIHDRTSLVEVLSLFLRL